MSKQEFNNVREKYADKIAKLLRKAESTTPEEAETCLRMAQNLMTKWGIDEAMLEAARGLSVDEIVTEEIVLTGGFRVALGELAMYVIHFNGGKAVLIENSPREVDGKVRKQTYILRVHAFKSDLERIRILNTSLQLQAMTSQNRWWKENRHLYFDKREEFLGRRQFIFSFARSAGTKIKEATERGREQAIKDRAKESGESVEATGTSVELVLVDRKTQLERWYDEEYGDTLRTSRARSQRAGDRYAHAAGTEAGRNADVGQPGVGGGRKGLPS